jgi:ABC-2 type transport system permease protein
MSSSTRSFEWRLLRADRTFPLLAFCLAALVAYALRTGVSWVGFQNRTIERAMAEETERIAAHRARIDRIAAGDTAGLAPWLDPRLPSNAGGTLAARYTVLPPAALAPLAIGQSDLYPYYAKISTRTKHSFIVNDEIENPVNLLSGRFDLAFVVVYLFPLFILALTYDVISGERERGTLALLLSQPVRPGRVIADKLVVRAAAALALVVGFSIAGAVVLGVDLAAPGALVRLALWMTVVALYGAFWVACALAVNTLGRSSAANAVMLLAVWLAVVVVVPALYNLTVTTVAPSPSRVELTTALRDATDGATEQGNVLLQRYYLDHPELMGAGGADMDNYAARSVAVQEAVEQSMAQTLERFDQRLAVQQSLADRYRFVSPAIVAHAALLDVTGTGAHRYAHFQRLVDDYHATWRAFFFPRIFSRTQLAAADYDALPAFEFREEPTRAVLERMLPGFLGLALPVMVILLVANRALGRGRTWHS